MFGKQIKCVTSNLNIHLKNTNDFQKQVSITFKKMSLLSRAYITFEVTKVVVFVVEQTEM